MKILSKPLILIAGTFSLLAAGCKKVDHTHITYIPAINAYYASHPACLWSEPVRFPVQADTSNTAETTGYDALVDQGLLTRTTAEKTRLIILSKQVTNYDLSEKGHAAWTPDQQQPGFGNFCYGARTVTSIDNVAPLADQPGDSATVTYHVAVVNPPAWATAPETQNAFPRVHTDLAGPTEGTATVRNGAVMSGPLDSLGRPSGKATAADGAVVR